MSLITHIDFLDKKSDKGLLKESDFQLHDQLTDNADWNNEYWDFNVSYLPSYAAKIENLYSQSVKGFSFSAMNMASHGIANSTNRFRERSANTVIHANMSRSNNPLMAPVVTQTSHRIV